MHLFNALALVNMGVHRHSYSEAHMCEHITRGVWHVYEGLVVDMHVTSLPCPVPLRGFPREHSKMGVGLASGATGGELRAAV